MSTPKPVYLDYAAATPVDQRVLAAMAPYWSDQFANPAAPYSAGRAAREALDEARSKVACTLGVQSHEIIFTAGATESLNLAILGFAKANPGSSIITSAIEHDAILAVARTLAKDGHAHKICPVDDRGLVNPEDLTQLLDDEVGLVSVIMASNEIGTIQPLAAIGQVIARVRADRAARGITMPLYFHTDASAAAGALDLHPSRLGVDLMTLNGAKIYGPKQTGCLYVRSGIELAPIIYGGGGERGLRAGTLSLALAVGFATALDLAQAERALETVRLEELREHCLRALSAAVPDIVLNGHPKKRLAGNLNITIPGIDGEALVLYLDEAGIMAATGSACTAGNGEPSHVVLALGRTRAEAAASLRLTFGRDTTAESIDRLVAVLPGIVKRLRELGRSSAQKPLQ